MALTPPEATATPVSQAEANAAFTVMNGYVTDAYTETNAALAVVREHIRITNGSVALLDELDSNTRTLGSSTVANPSVAADPGTKAQVNNALVTMASIIDRLNSRAGTALAVMRQALRITDGVVLRLDRFDTTSGDLASPAALTAEAVTTDVGPGTDHTEFNTACANTTAFIDTANAEIKAILNEFMGQYSLTCINDRFARMKEAVDALN